MSAGPWDPDPFRGRVAAALAAFVAARRGLLDPLGGDAERLLDAASDAVAGGKRLRAMFCWWGFHVVRVPDDAAEEEALVRAAAALELLHASALVHDDLMDASDTRRGRPATHRAFADRHRRDRWRGDPEQYGAAAAVLLGDLLLSWSDELLRTSGLPTPAVLDALRFFDATRSEVVAGQFLDVSVQARGGADVAQSMRVVRYKSAKYSVERPLHIGAALAGAGPEVIGALTAYGVPLGEAFQLRDDLLGVFGDPSVTGKPAGDDLSEGKRTVLVALALEQLPGEDAELLDRSLGQPLDDDGVRHLQRLIDGCGARAEVERRIAGLTEQALGALAGAALHPGAAAALSELAAAATQRSV